jgi:hypothetical protein
MRTTILAATALAALATGASAKPLPAGMKVVIVKDRPMVKQGAFTVPLLDSEVQGNGTSIKASLSDDGKTIQAIWDRCGAGGDDGDNTHEVPLAHVTARLENYAGMAAHLKKKYADAIPHFAAAVAANPDEPMFQTNLLSAQSMSGKLDDADKTIATYGPKNRAWFVWRLAVDKELAAVKARASAQALRASVAGKVTTAALGENAAIAGDLVAMIENQGNGGPTAPIEEDLLVFDAAAGRQLLRLPIVTMDDACSDAPSEDGGPLPKCTAKQRAANAAHARDADAVLAQLGVAVVTGARVDVSGDAQVVTSPDRKVKVDFSGDAPKVTAGGKAFATDPVEHLVAVVFVGAHVLFEASDRHIYYCDDDSFRVGLVAATPATAP